MRKLRRSDVVTCTVDGEIVILDRAAGYVHQLNSTASDIWRACDGRHSVEDIVAHVTERFESAPEGVFGDVVAALAELERLGLLRDEHPVEYCSGESSTVRGTSS